VREGGPNDLFVATYNGVLRSNLFLEVQFSRQQFEFLDAGGTDPDILASPFIDPATGGFYNAPYFDATDPEDRNNRQVTGSLSYFLSTESLGRHDLKVGYESFRNTRTGGNSQSASDFVFYTDYLRDVEGAPVQDGTQLVPVFTPFSSFILNWQAERGGRLDITTNSFFVNDRWTLNDHWSFNVGVRYEKVRSEATGGIVGIDTDTIVPRLAASFDVRGDGRFRLDATYAHYAGGYNTALFSNNTNVGRPSLVYGIYAGPAGEGEAFAPGFDPANYITVGGFFPTANVRFEDGLSSPVTREWTLAGGVQWGAGRYAKLAYVNRRIRDFVEDLILFENGSTVVMEDGEPLLELTNTVFQNSNLPTRDYRGLQLQAGERITDAWRVEGHYTLQLANEGNYEGEEGASIFPSAVGDFPEIFVADRNYPLGRLRAFQRHKARVWTNYDLGLGRFGRVNLGLLWRYNSALGYSLAAANVNLSDVQAARDPGYADTPPTQTLFFGERGREDYRGAHLFDLAVNYEIPVWRSLRPWAKFEAFNLFNNDTLTRFNTTIEPDYDGPVDTDGLPTTFSRDARFGQATSQNSYPVPRTLQFSVGFRS